MNGLLKHRSLSYLTRILMLGMLLGVASCGGRSTVVTQDESAEYRNAQSLPPLKKPASAVTTPTAEPTTTPATKEVKPGNTTVAARVVEAGKNEVELEIIAPADEAWRFMRKNLGTSDLTVHTRNKAARRFSIGCSSLEGEAEKPDAKKGGWSLFNRSKDTQQHCALMLESSRGTTRVKVLGRDGEPVSADSAREIFSRLLNN